MGPLRGGFLYLLIETGAESFLRVGDVPINLKHQNRVNDDRYNKDNQARFMQPGNYLLIFFGCSSSRSSVKGDEKKMSVYSHYTTKIFYQ
jgi:hypothetical protein